MLAKASPRNRREVRYSGPSLEAFQQAYLSHSPAATVRANRHAGPADLLVLQDCDPAKLNAAMLDELMPGAVVIASTRLGRQADDVERAFTDGGFAILPSDLVLAPAGKALVRAQKSPAAGISRVEIYPYARLLMDIRTRLPADALRTEPGLAIHYVSPPFVRYADWIGQPRVVILQRPGGQKPHQWQQFAAAGLQAKEVLIIEFDDHPELIAQILGRPAPDAGAWEMFRVAHAIQTSTDELVELFQQYNPEVRAFPNAAFDIVPFPSRRPPRRVFYGGVTRGPFVADIARALKPAIDAHPDVEFVVIGDRAFFDALPTDRKTFHNYAIYEHYLELMAGCSVSLSPLQDRPMIETKSDAKYIDASRAGVLTIASPPVYDRTIRSGENGFIARTIEDWPAMLAMVLGDEVLRQRIARTAWEDVRDHRMFAHQAAARSAWYADLLARREALDAGIIARSPEVGQFLTQLRNRG
jgi:glycosyltransferase involved in cell wall biosynthesis